MLPAAGTGPEVCFEELKERYEHPEEDHWKSKGKEKIAKSGRQDDEKTKSGEPDGERADPTSLDLSEFLPRIFGVGHFSRPSYGASLQPHRERRRRLHVMAWTRPRECKRHRCVRVA